MQKRKCYNRTKFPARVIEEAHDLFISLLDRDKPVGAPGDMSVTIGNESWNLDTREEFLAEYIKTYRYRFDHIERGNRLILDGDSWDKSASVLVCFPTRQSIEAVFNVFERNLEISKVNVEATQVVVESDPLRVFVGHGHDQQWRDLKDHLHDQHGIEVVAYEIGPRAGLSVKEVLQQMLNASSIAFLVLTGEDIHTDGELHARENVIHELGLFQGQLGFTRAIALLEEDVAQFSNILGINQIRFSKGRIRETFGDVLATIKREFGTG